MKRNVCILLFCLLFINCAKDPVKPEPKLSVYEKISKIKGIQIEEIETAAGFEHSYSLIYKQPVDHSNPTQYFNQRMYLHHRNDDAPMVFMPSGYSANPNRMSELTDALNANQLVVTHRYMADARPEVVDWNFLTVEQAAADHHRIVQVLKSVYSNKWLSYGISKNGMTALFHKRFYPNDVDATVALVAPIMNGIADPRFDRFLETVGTKECRDRIINYQRALLEKRDEIIPLIQNFINNSNLSFTVAPGLILEYEVCEYPFAFWQYGLWECNTIPDTNASIAKLYEHLEQGGGFPLYSQQYMDYYSPIYYQAYTELGWYRLYNDNVKDLLVNSTNPSYSLFAPPNAELNFDPVVMDDISTWLKESGNNIIYIYGADDPWTAAALEPNASTNSIMIIQQNANHSVKIADLDKKDLVYQTLSDWLGLEIGSVTKMMKIDNPSYRTSEYHDIEYNLLNR